MDTLELKNRFLKHHAVILKSIVNGKEPSKASIYLLPGHPLFNDSLNHSQLIYELNKFINTLEEMIKYNEIIIKSEKE